MSVFLIVAGIVFSGLFLGSIGLGAVNLARFITGWLEERETRAFVAKQQMHARSRLGAPRLPDELQQAALRLEDPDSS